MIWVWALATTFDLTNIDLSAIEQSWGTAQRNRSVDGNAISLGGVKFSSGIGTHAVSDFTIALAPGSDRFQAKVGLEDEAPKGSVTFEVYVDGVRKFESPLMRTGDAPRDVEVALNGAKRLRLVVTDGGDTIDYDHATWAQPFILGSGDLSVTKIVRPTVEPPMPIAMTVPAKPEFNGARRVGCTAGRPFLWRVPVSGKRPMTIRATDLPTGVSIEDGVIRGVFPTKRVYKVTLTASNGAGKSARTVEFDARGLLALTPPMGWNSWNVWGTDVDAKKVSAAAKYLVSTGLADFGFDYVNIDDAWESAQRTENGMIGTNEKFGDIRKLAEEIHGVGLKLGIYSSPGPRTCAGYLGSHGHEQLDANRYAEWGIDYLKYDWCSYGGLVKDAELPTLKAPYAVMRRALDQVPRDIVYSLCQYGMGDVYKWGQEVGGNLWRTTGDITDTWTSMSNIGFSHSVRSPFAKPGGWNDPDMLVVGHVGWSKNIRPTRLTPNEQITHITLWSMLAAPLIIGCDLTKLDEFTGALLRNHDVIEVNQDTLGKAAERIWKEGDLEVWTRPLANGDRALAMFNRGPESKEVKLTFSTMRLPERMSFYDCWQRKSVGKKRKSFAETVPRHGARLYRLTPVK